MDPVVRPKLQAAFRASRGGAGNDKPLGGLTKPASKAPTIHALRNSVRVWWRTDRGRERQWDIVYKNFAGANLAYAYWK
jgi:hypothetical protein